MLQNPSITTAVSRPCFVYLYDFSFHELFTFFTSKADCRKTLNYLASYHRALHKVEQTSQRLYPVISGHAGEEQAYESHTRVALNFLVCKDIFSYKNLQIYQYKIIMMISVFPQLSSLGFLPIHLVETTLVKIISEFYFAKENDHFFYYSSYYLFFQQQ